MSRLDLIVGDNREWLSLLPADHFHTCATSPPYFGLRDYGVDGQIGLEESPEAFVQQLVDVFREVRRVLRPDGTLWLNLGDTYAADRGGTDMPAQTVSGGVGGKGNTAARRGMPENDGLRPKRGNAHRRAGALGLKHKDLIGIPWLVALALRADGWYLRQDIIWAKPNPMPESVKDRCTKSHEYLFLLTKSDRYYFDADAIKEPAVSTRPSGNGFAGRQGGADYTAVSGGVGSSEPWAPGKPRNRRSVWNVQTRPFKGAHFATFPVELVEPCILAGSPVGGRVLDPFGGAGTTGLAALRNGRDATLIELNPEYAALAEVRIAAG